MHGINQRVGSIEHWATNQASASTTPSSQSDLSSSTKLITTLASELPNPKLLGPGASVTQMTAWKQSITDKYAPLINGLSSQQKRDMPPHVNPAQVQLYIKHVFRGYGLAESIISDRDSLFTSDYWLAFHRAIETTLKMTTAYHPQADGQTEVVNRTLLSYHTLHLSASHRLEGWLTHAEFCYNNTTHSATGFSPYFFNHGYHPRTPADRWRTDGANPDTNLQLFLQLLQDVQITAVNAVTHVL